MVFFYGWLAGLEAHRARCEHGPGGGPPRDLRRAERTGRFWGAFQEDCAAARHEGPVRSSV